MCTPICVDGFAKGEEEEEELVPFFAKTPFVASTWSATVAGRDVQGPMVACSRIINCVINGEREIERKALESSFCVPKTTTERRRGPRFQSGRRKGGDCEKWQKTNKTER